MLVEGVIVVASVRGVMVGESVTLVEESVRGVGGSKTGTEDTEVLSIDLNGDIVGLSVTV